MPAVDALGAAPREVTTKQLRELHIRLNLPERRLANCGESRRSSGFDA